MYFLKKKKIDTPFEPQKKNWHTIWAKKKNLTLHQSNKKKSDTLGW